MESIEGQIPKYHIMPYKSDLFYELFIHLHTMYCMVYQSTLVYYETTVYERITAVSTLFPC